MKRNFSFHNFFLSILLVLLVYPAVEGRDFAGRFFSIFFTWMLLSGLLAVSGDSFKRKILALVFGLPTITFIWIDQFYQAKIIDYVAYSFIFVFIAFVVTMVFIYLLKAKRVTSEILLAAGSAYLLLGIFWAVLFGFIQYINPQSFSFSGQGAAAQLFDNWSTFIYYSFTTLTTLGYGDIVPATSRAQSFAIVEAATGVLFQALLISRLVGMYISHNIKKEEAK